MSFRLLKFKCKEKKARGKITGTKDLFVFSFIIFFPINLRKKIIKSGRFSNSVIIFYNDKIVHLLSYHNYNYEIFMTHTHTSVLRLSLSSQTRSYTCA